MIRGLIQIKLKIDEDAEDIEGLAEKDEGIEGLREQEEKEEEAEERADLDYIVGKDNDVKSDRSVWGKDDDFLIEESDLIEESYVDTLLFFVWIVIASVIFSGFTLGFHYALSNYPEKDKTIHEWAWPKCRLLNASTNLFLPFKSVIYPKMAVLGHLYVDGKLVGHEANRCLATFLREDWLLTPASCCQPVTRHRKHANGTWINHSGGAYIEVATVEHTLPIKIHIEKCIPHPKYIGYHDTVFNLALIKVKKPRGGIPEPPPKKIIDNMNPTTLNYVAVYRGACPPVTYDKPEEGEVQFTGWATFKSDEIVSDRLINSDRIIIDKVHRCGSRTEFHGGLLCMQNEPIKDQKGEELCLSNLGSVLTRASEFAAGVTYLEAMLVRLGQKDGMDPAGCKEINRFVRLGPHLDWISKTIKENG